MTSLVCVPRLHGGVDVLDEEGDELADQPRVDGRPHVVWVLRTRCPVDAHHVAVLLQKQRRHFFQFIWSTKGVIQIFRDTFLALFLPPSPSSWLIFFIKNNNFRHFSDPPPHPMSFLFYQNFMLKLLICFSKSSIFKSLALLSKKSFVLFPKPQKSEFNKQLVIAGYINLMSGSSLWF